MTDDNNATPAPEPVSDALSPQEQAYWDSQGQTDEPKAAEAPKAEAAPEPKAEAEPEKPEAEPEVEKLVKHGAFEEERQRRKKAQQEAQAAQVELARLRGQLEALNPAQQKPADPAAPQKIDIERDPIAALKALQAKLDAQEQAQQQDTAFRSDMQRIAQIGTRHAEKFAAVQPAFFDSQVDGKTVQGAYSFMRAQASDILRQQHPGATQAQIEAAVDIAERKHIEECLQNGDNAAEKLWELALAQGYKAPVSQAPRAPNGQFQKAEKTEAEKIADRAQAQKASLSLGSVPAGDGGGGLTLEALAGMDDEEFSAAVKGKSWEKLHRNGVI